MFGKYLVSDKKSKENFFNKMLVHLMMHRYSIR